MHKLMQGVDLLLTPVIPFSVPSLAQLAELRMQPGYRSQLLRYTAPFDKSGHPTITLPAGLAKSSGCFGTSYSAH
jgi:amidase